MTYLTPERIAELRALCDKATPGPWAWTEAGDDGFIVGGACDAAGAALAGHVDIEDLAEDVAHRIVAEGPGAVPVNLNDAAFIAASREALPTLLAALEQSQEELRSLRHAVCPVSDDPRTDYVMIAEISRRQGDVQGETAMENASLTAALHESREECRRLREEAEWADRNGTWTAHETTEEAP